MQRPWLCTTSAIAETLLQRYTNHVVKRTSNIVKGVHVIVMDNDVEGRNELLKKLPVEVNIGRGLSGHQVHFTMETPSGAELLEEIEPWSRLAWIHVGS